MARSLRKTFEIKEGSIDQRVIGIRVYGTSWHEIFEACTGFLDDENVPSGHFATNDLELLINLAERRLRQVYADIMENKNS